jgi:hypothetical protein
MLYRRASISRPMRHLTRAARARRHSVPPNRISSQSSSA